MPPSTTGFVPIRDAVAVQGLTVAAGTPRIFQLATFAAPGAAASDFAALIAWGDTTHDDKGQTIPFISYVEPPSINAGGSFVVTAQHDYQASGTYNVQVLIIDKAHSFNVTSSNVSTVLNAFRTANFASVVDPRAGLAINDALATTTLSATGGSPTPTPTPPPVTALAIQGMDPTVMARRRFTATVATFVAPAPYSRRTLRATIAWGDGSITRGRIVPTGIGTYAVMGTHRFRLAGVRVARITVTPRGAGGVSAFSTLTVT